VSTTGENFSAVFRPLREFTEDTGRRFEKVLNVIGLKFVLWGNFLRTTNASVAEENCSRCSRDIVENSLLSLEVEDLFAAGVSTHVAEDAGGRLQLAINSISLSCVVQGKVRSRGNFSALLAERSRHVVNTVHKGFHYSHTFPGFT